MKQAIIYAALVVDAPHSHGSGCDRHSGAVLDFYCWAMVKGRLNCGVPTTDPSTCITQHANMRMSVYGHNPPGINSMRIQVDRECVYRRIFIGIYWRAVMYRKDREMFIRPVSGLNLRGDRVRRKVVPNLMNVNVPIIVRRGS